MSRARAGRANPIDVIEAAYDLERDDRGWLRNLATLVRPLIDDGFGLTAYTYDLATNPAEWFANAEVLGTDRSILVHALELARATSELVSTIHTVPAPLGGLLDIAERGGIRDVGALPAFQAHFKVTGVADYVAFRTVEPGTRGVVMTAGQGERRSVQARSRQLWARVAAHVAAGRRLRAGIQAAHVEAVLAPNGRVEHAEGECTTRTIREQLREAVLRQDGARSRRGRVAESATEAWTALVAGRWSLVDQFERNGRRFIVARRNEHVVANPRALTPRERAVVHLAALGKPNKLIAYELGLGTSSVATKLAVAMRKLGVRSRADLISLVATVPTE